MGFLDTTAKILNTTSKVLNEVAFGDIKNIFRGGDSYLHKNGSLYDFRMRPIGLYQKSYDFMLDHIYRNIGNTEYTYDGYSTPIGELCNPFYNSIVSVPWFYLDEYKNSTSNYIEYIKKVYGATISVKNINTSDYLFHLSDDAAAVGVVSGDFAIEALTDDDDLIPNPNKTGTDTHMALDSGYYNRETLINAKVANDKRNSYGFGISSDMYKMTGINTENIENSKTYFSKKQESETGRFVDGDFSPLTQYINPLEESNYGNLNTFGSYLGYFNSLTNKSKQYYYKNVSKNKYHISVNNVKIEGEKIELDSFNYFLKLGINVSKESLASNRVSNGSPNDSGVLSDTVVNSLRGKSIRYIFQTIKEHSNIIDANNGGVYVYTESENGKSINIPYTSFNYGTKFGKYVSYNDDLSVEDLLKKTNDGFKNGLYKTIIARFNTGYDTDSKVDTTQTAVSRFGLSHGRNLLKKRDELDKDENGYNNPYCRAWTFHHQYYRLADSIRPLPYTAEQLYNQYNFNAFTADHSDFGNGRARLEKYGTLNKDNGLVNITPIDSSDKKVDIKNCMFSIENLAWKDAFSTSQKQRETFQSGGLSSEQKGPFGGRIMWFPPYDLEFNEDINVNWNENNFIGRGEGIYTYTNTTRTGNLSFKILVDHPSIINYWKRRGEKNAGDSVDDVDSPEQELLRFFAGCDMLTGKQSTIPEPESVSEDEPIPSPDTQIIKFFVFFPNNYSGVDDDADFAVKYLVNGLGAGKVKQSESGETVDYKIPFAKAKNGYGGYEMIPGKPISIDGSKSQSNDDLHITDTTVGGTNVSLYALEGESGDKWWHRKWYYRVDKAYKNQLLKKSSYVDEGSYGLNSIASLSKVAEQFGVEDVDSMYSFSDVFVALEGGDASSVLSGTYDQAKVDSLKNKLNQYDIDHIDCIGRASSQGHSKSNTTLQSNRAKTIKNWLSTKSGFNASSINVATGGTGGDTGINNGDESGITNKMWRCVETNIYLKKSASKTTQAAISENSTPLEDGDLHQNNFVNTPEKNLETYRNCSIGRLKVFNDLSANKMVETDNSKDKDTSTRLNHVSDNTNGLALNLRESSRISENAYIVSDRNGKPKVVFDDELGGKSDFNYTFNSMHDNAAQDEEAGLNNSVEDKAEVATVDGVNSKYYAREKSDNNQATRYDNEATFFSLLEKEEPFLHHRISDKIKYFDPAFHSISPEGFNARLTFLQQCTRQGPTIGNSDNGTETTANNLAFGRPPVCILRIGDFYYTKILINGLSLSFDPLMWDLNSEGIGVMPMIANVNIKFTFIGGSSLAGHIARLQNALSFNYYANTEVYDNRSELAEYDENGKIVKFAPYNPNI